MVTPGSASTFNRLGFFSDLYYDRNRNKWWGVSDRGPGGGVISYDTRLQRFTIDINGTTGAISNFQVQQTVLFKSAGVPLNGLAPSPTGTPPTLTAGREPNRGFEGLAISPDGKYAYAMLQNGTITDGWTSSARGKYTRIVKFDVVTGEAVAQYAYELESTAQGRGISSIVALGDDKFLVLERQRRVGHQSSNHWQLASWL